MTHKRAGETEATYCVEGMHCPNCEIRIEKRLRKLTGVRAASADTRTGRVLVRCQGRPPTAAVLNDLFCEDEYKFSDSAAKSVMGGADVGTTRSPRRALTIVALSAGLIGAFVLLGQSGLSSAVRVDSRSSLPAFFVFGLLAGASSCAALVGGLVLSMSRQWMADYASKPSWLGPSQPHFLFNLGRLVSFGGLGAALGAIGGQLRPSTTFSSVLVALCSLLMIALGLQLIGVKGIAVQMPKALTRFASDESHFRGRYMPFVMGALTFILPCGFTITAQSVALLSGSPVQGGLIMLFFALGTLPMLLGIGLSSTGLLSNRRTSAYFMPVAGVLVLFFAVYNLNSQMNVLGLMSLSDLTLQPTQSVSAAGAQKQGPVLATVANGKQVLRMEASAYGYSPRWFRVRAGIPVRWEITDTGTSGCTNAVVSPRLFEDSISLETGTTSVKEFTPQKAGVYKFSCWMGMVWGVIEVVS
jgi:uncharacterized protein